jgi:hypothetical protein
MNNDLIKKYTVDLEKIHDIDQRAIKDFESGKISTPELTKININNVNTIKDIIGEIGFPTIQLTSEKAYRTTVLVILHSGDLELLNNSIKTMENMDASSIQRKDIPYMIDKSRVIQGRPQLYGTQYKIDKDGIFEFIEIENPEELEKRRALYGMESFTKYRKTIEQNLRNK